MKTGRALSVREMAVFAMLGAILLVSKLIFEPLPNLHPVGMLIMVYTLVYRAKALIPLYLFVFLFGLYYGFSVWWVPYLYIWTILWAMTMLLPRNMPRTLALPVYAAVCSLHGLLYGTLFAPFQALVFGYSFRAMLAWIAAGFSFDILHALGNLAASLLILPLITAMKRLQKEYR